MARTKYGQQACDICKVEPPLGTTGICFKCSRGEDPTPFVEPEEPPAAAAVVTARAEPVSPAATEDVKVKVKAPRKAVPPARKSVPTPTANTPTANTGDWQTRLKTASRAELEQIIAFQPTNDEEGQRIKRLARSRLWHLKQKEK